MGKHTIVVTAGQFPTKIMYREPGKLYNVADEQGPGNAFDEAIIQPGENWTLPPGAEFIKAVDLEGVEPTGKSGDD